MHEEVWSCLAPWGSGGVTQHVMLGQLGLLDRMPGQVAEDPESRAYFPLPLFVPPQSDTGRAYLAPQKAPCVLNTCLGGQIMLIACAPAIDGSSCLGTSISIYRRYFLLRGNSFHEQALTNGRVPVVPAVSIPQVVGLLCTFDQRRGRGSVCDMGDGSADNY